MRQASRRVLKDLQARFHTLPLDKEWLKKHFGERWQIVYSVLKEAIKEGLAIKVLSIGRYVVWLDGSKKKRRER